MSKVLVVAPWHNPEQKLNFVEAWDVHDDPRLLLVQDENREGCARTKNRGVLQAMELGAEVVVVLDDDCFPHPEAPTLDDLIDGHLAALEPQPVSMFEVVTDPPSRGTPYFDRSMRMPVAASMGFWTGIGDYDAPGQLVHGATLPMNFRRSPVFWRWFPLCGMNLAFRPQDWRPWWQFIDVPRFDDIWQGFLWQKEAWRRGHCFNLNGPLVTHSRQSNVWANLRDEAQNLEANERLWRAIAESPETDYFKLRALLPL